MENINLRDIAIKRLLQLSPEQAAKVLLFMARLNNAIDPGKDAYTLEGNCDNQIVELLKSNTKGE